MSDNYELLPPTGDEHVGYKIFDLLNAVIKNKEMLRLPQRWTRYYELAVNRHWKSKSKKFNLLSANLIHAHLSKISNLLTDNSPTFNVIRLGQTDDQDEIYDRLLRTAEYWWNEEEQQQVLSESVLNGEIYGCTIEKVHFNPDREYGLGEVETEVVDPFYFGLYPTDCRRVQDAEAVLHFWPMSLREVKRRWPDKAEYIRSDTDILTSLGDTRKEMALGKQGGGLWGSFAGVVKSLTNTIGRGIGDDEAETVLVVECWVKDFSTEGGAPKYPGYIRCVTTCSGGQVVLADRLNPSINSTLAPERAIKTYLWDRFPFSFTQSNTDTTNPWGMSDIEQLKQLQEELDKTMSEISLMKDRASRMKLINPRDSGVDNSQFTNAPGIINPTSSQQGQGIRYMDPPQIPADLVNALGMYKDYFFMVAGSFELEAGQAPGSSVIAFKAIQALLERAGTMLRGKIRNYSRMIRERGRMYLSCAMNWYTEERYVSYDQDGESMVQAVTGVDLIVPAKLTIVSGSTMPRSQIQAREEAIELFKLGGIDQEELLKKMDWPDRKAVLARMRAGPLSQTINALSQLGYPQPIIDIVQRIGEMDAKAFKASMKSGELPMFQQILPAIVGQQQQDDPTKSKEAAEVQKAMADAQKASAEAQRAMAEVRKVMAEVELVAQQAKTEQVTQEVKQAGIQFDAEQLRLKRAQFLKESQLGDVNTKIKGAQTEHSMQMDRHSAVLSSHDAQLKALQTAHNLHAAAQADQLKVHDAHLNTLKTLQGIDQGNQSMAQGAEKHHMDKMQAMQGMDQSSQNMTQSDEKHHMDIAKGLVSDNQTEPPTSAPPSEGL